MHNGWVSRNDGQQHIDWKMEGMSRTLFVFVFHDPTLYFILTSYPSCLDARLPGGGEALDKRDKHSLPQLLLPHHWIGLQYTAKNTHNAPQLQHKHISTTQTQRVVWKGDGGGVLSMGVWEGCLQNLPRRVLFPALFCFFPCSSTLPRTGAKALVGSCPVLS